jgi:aminoglycoside phosphotransferase (APT) family kinase protein
MPSWDAEIVVDAGLAEGLIADQFPELGGEPVVPLGSGWDYTAYRVGTQWVFRFPRREVVLEGMAREIAALPFLAPFLPAAVPAARFVGSAGAGFPWPFFGAPFVPGREPADAALDDEARAALARRLGAFLRALHGPEALAAAGGNLPVDPIWRADMRRRVPMARERLAELGFEVSEELEDAFAHAEALPPPERAVVCHGDFHLRQLLVDENGLSGVIDWVDVCRSDPGIDFAVYWSVFPVTARGAFLDAYGEISEASLLRGRVLALMLNATLVPYARVHGLGALEREALAGLERAATP